MFLHIVGLRLPRSRVALLSSALVVSVCVAAMIVVPNIISWYASGFFSLTIFCILLCMWFVCLRGSLRDILFCCVAAQLTQNLAYNLEGLIYIPFKNVITPFGWLALSLTCTIIVYGVSANIFRTAWLSIGRISIKSGYVIAFAIMSALFVYVMQYLFQVYEIDQIWVARLPLILCCIAGLSIQFGFLALRNGEIERASLEHVMRQEAQQYAIATQTIDRVNMKAHDLKHQVMKLRSSGQMDLSELDDIEQSIEQYDAIYETGNAELDTVLNQKVFLCKKYQIDHTIMVDGECLNFMRPSDILSLFGNFLDNAIEHEQTVESVALRYVTVHIHRKADMIAVRVENYCVTPPRMERGLPVTTKSDSFDHGFGMRSIAILWRDITGRFTWAWTGMLL
ncbi:hypothetical protein HMPREF2909_02855 [Alloscardovia sp. HMSC034E08]|nr:hypothetical protein HMPREF2909_02855 [Alloscardovia sp. HMSC034E08]